MKNRVPPSQRPERSRGTPTINGMMEIAPSVIGSSGPLLPLRQRETIAEAVHLAVCKATDSDGFGHCALYARAGMLLLGMLRPDARRYYLQVGDLHLAGDPDDPALWFGFNSENGGLERGEFHAWIMSADGVLIDFASRHYRGILERLFVHQGVISQAPGAIAFLIDHGAERPVWRREEPPAFIWTRGTEIPTWVNYLVEPASTTAYYEQMHQSKSDSVALGKLAFHHYRRLAAERAGG